MGGACFIHGIQCLQDLVGARPRTPNSKAFILNPVPCTHTFKPKPLLSCGIACAAGLKTQCLGFQKQYRQECLIIAYLPTLCARVVMYSTGTLNTEDNIVSYHVVT